MNTVYIKKALNMNVWTYALINILTLDIYFVYFQYKLTEILRQQLPGEEFKPLLSKLKVQFDICLYSTALGIAIFLLALMGFETLSESYLADATWIVSLVAAIFWSFTARKALYAYVIKTHDVEVSIPGPLLFLFPGIMLITAINDIELNIELKRMREEQRQD